jgi:hypothetical protein
VPVLPNPPNPPNGLALAIVVVLVVAGLEPKPLPNPPKPPVVPLGAKDELRPPKLKPELVVEVVPPPRLKLGAVDAAAPKEKPVLPNPAERKISLKVLCFKIQKSK